MRNSFSGFRPSIIPRFSQKSNALYNMEVPLQGHLGINEALLSRSNRSPIVHLLSAKPASDHLLPPRNHRTRGTVEGGARKGSVHLAMKRPPFPHEVANLMRPCVMVRS